MKELYNRVISIVTESSNGKSLIELSIELEVPIIDIMDCLMVAVGFKRLYATSSGENYDKIITYTSTKIDGCLYDTRDQLLIEGIRLGLDRPDVISEDNWEYLKDLCRLCGEIN